VRLVLFVLCLAVACEPDGVQVGTQCVTDRSLRAEATRFIVDCAAAANPKSDEEGEDLVDACARSALDWFCRPVTTVFVKYRGFVRCDVDPQPGCPAP